jgi:hypothetical protein
MIVPIYHPFCSKHHTETTDPKIFRLDGLRNCLGSTIIKSRDGRDSYTGASIDIKDTRNTQLDHIHELQVARNAYDTFSSTLSKSDSKTITLAICKGFNDTSNLNFTTTIINQSKGGAVTSFLDDFKSDSLISENAGITEYLLDRSKFTRQYTDNICKELLSSYDSVVSTFHQENSLESLFCDEFHNLCVTGMRLK